MPTSFDTMYSNSQWMGIICELNTGKYNKMCFIISFNKYIQTKKFNLPSEYCIFALIETIVSNGEQLSSKAVPVRVSINNSMRFSAISKLLK